ncbi:hypothetical protein [Phenylobacterium sp.]|uniref:hypothetical protein n=1 Tax=Phenylobacterium sp. TaxID=1871053 RepID=UPI00286C3CBB|nr:hypothetical protein [Phenylobacterium sp.]
MPRLIIVMAALSVAGSAQAQIGQRANPDLDKDGRVTLAEFRKSQADGMMARFDANKDGKIARGELAFPPGMSAIGERIWERLDANKDATVTRAEMDAAASVRFERGDTNKDGWLSKGEILTLRQNRGRDAG